MPSTRSWPSNKAGAFTRLIVPFCLGLLCFSVFLASPAYAGEATAPPAAGQASPGNQANPFAYQLPTVPSASPVDLWGVLFNIVIVLGLFGGALWVLKKFLPGKLGDLRRSRHMRVLDTMPLAMGRSLLLVSVGSEVHLMASTEKGIESLGRVENLGAIEQEIAEDFTQVLSQEMGLPETMGRLKNRLRKFGEGSGA